MPVSIPEGKSLNAVETSTLRSAFLLAASALSHTHVVDDEVLRNLADVTLKAYLTGRRLSPSLTSQQLEDLAVSSIEMLVTFYGDRLKAKH